MAKVKQAHKSGDAQETELTAMAVKEQLGSLLSRVGFGSERIAITRHGKRIAGLVSADDLDRLNNAA